MSEKERPPFRADHVGSLLRPVELLQAREKKQRGAISDLELREVEDRCIRDVVKLQEGIGLKGITDGEYRRSLWHADFLRKFEGVTVKEGLAPDAARKFQGNDESLERSPTRFEITGTLKRPHGVETGNFKFLASVTRQTAKVCIPSPSVLHFRGGRKSISRHAYPDMERFYADLARVYREEIGELAELGCTYLQLDDTNLAYLCDPKIRESVRDIGEDPNKLPHTYAKLINEAIKERPGTMTVCVHLCRGNFRSAWVAEGGYDPVAEVLFNELQVDGYFLEYDSPRAGDFTPLRYLPAGKRLVLGLVTTKTGELERAEDLKRRIDAASRHVSVEQLALSPQCGFSSTVLGNKITVEAEIAKLNLIVKVAHDVWGNI